jgi:hypothetical protein
MGVESKLGCFADETTDCCETETQRVPMPAEQRGIHDPILIRFQRPVDRLCITTA